MQNQFELMVDTLSYVDFDADWNGHTHRRDPFESQPSSFPHIKLNTFSLFRSLDFFRPKNLCSTIHHKLYIFYIIECKQQAVHIFSSFVFWIYAHFVLADRHPHIKQITKRDTHTKEKKIRTMQKAK